MRSRKNPSTPTKGRLISRRPGHRDRGGDANIIDRRSLLYAQHGGPPRDLGGLHHGVRALLGGRNAGEKGGGLCSHVGFCGGAGGVSECEWGFFLAMGNNIALES